MKRLLAALLIVVMAFPGIALGAENPQISETEGLAGAILLEPVTSTRLWTRNADQAYSVAGLSKLPAILTLAQAFDDGSLREENEIRVSSRAANVSGPTAFLSEGESISARELIKAAIMISAGDAIMALGESAYGSESVFVENINVTMRQLGLNKTSTDVLGTGMTFSAYELAVLGKAASESATFTKYCMLYLDGISHADGRETELVNANRLVKSYSGCRGILTGSSATDGYCGIFAATRNKTSLIAVVIGGENATKRTAGAIALLDYGFASFRTEILCKAGEVAAENIAVRDGDVRTINLVPQKNVTMVVETSAGKVKKTLEVPEYLEAPVAADEQVGQLIFTNEAGETVAQAPLYVEHVLEAYGLKDILKKIMAVFVG